MFATPPDARVTLPIADLADALGSTPERLAPLLELLADRHGAVRLEADARGLPAVTLPAVASRRLGLRRLDDGRWMADAEPTPEARRRATCYGEHADDRRSPADRVAALCRWLADWSGGAAPDPESPAGREPPASVPSRPAPPRSKATSGPRRHSFSLAELRGRVESARTAPAAPSTSAEGR
jgi:hypothetical protein